MGSIPFNSDESLLMDVARLITEIRAEMHNDPLFRTLYFLPHAVDAVMKKEDIPVDPEDNMYAVLDLMRPVQFGDVAAVSQQGQGVFSPEKTASIKASLVAQLRDVGSIPDLFPITRAEFIYAAQKFADPDLDDEAVLDLVRSDFEHMILYQFEEAAKIPLFQKRPDLLQTPGMQERVLNLHMDALASEIENVSKRVRDTRPVDAADLLRRMKEFDDAIRQNSPQSDGPG